MKQRLTKLMLSLSLLFAMQVANVANIFAVEGTQVKETITYEVSASLRKANDINADSMAARVLSKKASLIIKDNQMYATIEFLEGTIFGLAADVSSISYYEGSISEGIKKDPTTTLREGTQYIKTAIIPVSMNVKGTYGCYVQFKVDAMGASPDAYVEISDVNAGIQEQLEVLISDAQTYMSDAYTADSYRMLQTAISDAQTALGNHEDEIILNTCVQNLQTAIKNLEARQASVSLKNGNYNVKSDVLKADGTQSMAAQAVKGAILTVENNVITVDLKLGAVSMYGATAYIDNVEFEKETTWEKAMITARDAEGNVTGVKFILPENVEKTKVKFYYGGNQRGAEAVLYLGLNSATRISNFESDGTYHVDIALWHEKNDQASMAATAIDKEATVVVKDGKATMYINTKKMTFGTITAYLQELKVKHGESFEEASVYSKDEAGNPNKFSFALVSEDEYLDVLVNPHVAMMGNVDIAARLKVDYSTLTKVSDVTNAPGENTPITPGTADDNNSTSGTQTKTPIANTVNTKDTTNGALMGGLLMFSGLLVLYYFRRRTCKK